MFFCDAVRRQYLAPGPVTVGSWLSMTVTIIDQGPCLEESEKSSILPQNTILESEPSSHIFSKCMRISQ